MCVANVKFMFPHFTPSRVFFFSYSYFQNGVGDGKAQSLGVFNIFETTFTPNTDKIKKRGRWLGSVLKPGAGQRGPVQPLCAGMPCTRPACLQQPAAPRDRGRTGWGAMSPRVGSTGRDRSCEGTAGLLWAWTSL